MSNRNYFLKTNSNYYAKNIPNSPFYKSIQDMRDYPEHADLISISQENLTEFYRQLKYHME